MRKIICRRIRRKLVDYLYGETTEQEEDLIKKHLETCNSCWVVWNEIWDMLKTQGYDIEPEVPETYWEFYPKRVLTRISEQTSVRYNLKRILSLSSVCLLFLIAIVGTRFYLIEREIAKNFELYHNIEIVHNLDLINQIIENGTFDMESIQQYSEMGTTPYSKKILHRRFHQFQQYKPSQKDSILGNYQQWINYSPPERENIKKLYYFLKFINHPELKKLP